MYSYFKGIICEVESNYVTLEVNGIGYKIYVANPFSYEMGLEYKIYVYTKISEDEHSLFGFKERVEYELFMKLIKVKGLGPKLALPILATGSIAGIKDAIDRENILYLTKFPKIGEKLARQIVLDLKGKIDIEVSSEVDNSLDDLVSTLEALGYKTSEVKKVIGYVNKSNTLSKALSGSAAGLSILFITTIILKPNSKAFESTNLV